MQKLIAIFILSVSIACQDGYKVKAVYKPLIALEPEVSSSIKVLSDPSGAIRSEPEEGAAAYAGRLLDANCSAPVKDLGIKSEPKFSLPADSYYQALCLETTVLDAKGNVVKVKMQPIKIEGPEALALELPQDNQVIEFSDVAGATTYSYMVLDPDGLIVTTESDLTNSLIDFKNSLKLKTYKVIILARDAAGENLLAISIKLTIVPGSPKNPIALANVKFERRHYQTRSIKRLLVPQSWLSGAESLKINNTEFAVSQIAAYSGAFSALIDASDALWRGRLPYNGSSVAVSIIGLQSNLTPIPVTVRDFTSFSVFSSSYSDGSYAKNGMEAWVSSTHSGSVQSGGTTMATSFGLMIIQ